MTEKIILQVETYLEKNCRDYDWFAKKINPNWTSKEYLAFETLENYENFIEHLKNKKLNEDELHKEYERYVNGQIRPYYTVFHTWEDYENFIEPLQEQGLTDEEIDQQFKDYISRHEPRYSISGHDYLESVSLTEKIIRTLKNKIGLAGSYFSNYLFKLIKQKNLSDYLKLKFTKKQIWTGEFFQKSAMKKIICRASKQFLL